MNINTAAMSMAEGHPRYAMDVSMVFGAKVMNPATQKEEVWVFGIYSTATHNSHQRICSTQQIS